MKKTILAVETSCDETGLAVVEAGGGFSNPKIKVLENLVSSQIKIHRPFGGVVPNLAKREHLKNLPILFKKLKTAGTNLKNIDFITVTVGPGLEPALWTGINFAEELAKKYKKPLFGANHLEGHLYSFLLPKSVRGSRFGVRGKTMNSKHLEPPTSRTSNMFPAIALLVSGGHTALLAMKSLRVWKKLGETRDDAAGEAFDKVARMLELPYPGGPEIERLALSMPKGEKPSINFPKPMLNQKNYDFSFSGLKTSVFYYLRDKKLSTNNEFNTNIRIRKFGKDSLFADVAASFQRAVIEVLVVKTMRAAKEYGARSIILCGGVAANKKLRSNLRQATRFANDSPRFGEAGARRARDKEIKFIVSDLEYNNDNAAMIAAAAYIGLSRKKKYKLEAKGYLNI
ncbi:MAG: tRNA (adenosine(37)-N6)-threonylcarbamoyltransferase complex transferase subunit TsaD [Patescibacteria group bacterium]